MVMGLHLKRVEKPVLQSESESWRERVYKIALYHLNLSGQKVCSGEVCAVCSKSRNALSVFSKVKLEVWWSENSSNDWLLVTAKQTSLLWRNKLGNNPKKFPEKPSLLNIPKRMKGWGNQVKLTYSGKVFEGKSCYFAGKAIKVLDFDFMHVKH